MQSPETEREAGSGNSEERSLFQEIGVVSRSLKVAAAATQLVDQLTT